MRALSRSTVKPSTSDSVFGRMSIVPSAAGTSDSVRAVLRLLPLRVEVEAHLHLAGDLFARLRIVNVPAELRAGQQQLAGVRTHQFALLADGPFHEERTETAGWRRRTCGAGFLLLEIRDRVMGDATAFDRRRPNLNGAHPARLGQAGLRDAMIPGVLGHRRHREGL